MKTTAQIAERTEAAVVVRTVSTNLKPFSTGSAAFNWARKSGVIAPVTVLMSYGRGRVNVMNVKPVGDHYEGNQSCWQ